MSYGELLEKADPAILDEITPAKLEQRHQQNQAAVARLAEVLNQVNPDMVVIIGDDHKEVFHDDNMPALSVYWGETIPYRPTGIMKWKYDPDLDQALWYPQDHRDYPVASQYAERLIRGMMDDGFDVAQSKYFKDQQAMSHSFGYVYYKLMTEKIYPSIPVSINTYYPPNNVSPLRAYRIGQSIRREIESWSEDLRVVVMSTGGLSHFVVDEAFDRHFLERLAAGGPEIHAELPLQKLQSGNSEFRCWSALAGAVDGMTMDLIDYIPCYRSPAGTGCAMAFATWS
ncbi:extradiol ring-cleavage dioxygenase [Pandoraea fibrosis]|uniref:Extradiol ring-cleavage dioxygenase n=1 Tax=Pandoraea fibrosis TaxID=1891094 RepID=A0ABX6HRU5_9BURK|nr:extradiol ring-cleavage dioxygenase [Pandoraea fibrosis]QHF13239.1 extradiol ring-cleavage dioxygenase [Pandoraea fibrosis]